MLVFGVKLGEFISQLPASKLIIHDQHNNPIEQNLCQSETNFTATRIDDNTIDIEVEIDGGK